MKLSKYLLLTAAIMSINIAYAQSSGKGYTIISQEKFYDVPMPSWMMEGKSNINNSGTIKATAYPAVGHVSPSVTAVKGNISGDFHNDTRGNQYYTFDEFVCVTNAKCNEYKTTVGIVPDGYHHHDETLPLAIQIGKPGTYQNVTSCMVTGAGSAKVIDYAPVTIVK
jgi:hypothetical protein